MILDAQTAVITNANQNEQGKVQKLTEIQESFSKLTLTLEYLTK